jgi:hypothetical protein
MRNLLVGTALLTSLGLLVGCDSPADVASRNLSLAADNFQIPRRIVFYNGITDTYMLTIEGFCAFGNNEQPKQRTITCKTGPNEYKKHFLGLSDNVTYFAEQMTSADVSTYQYKVIFRPSTILPDIGVDVGGGAAVVRPK